MKKGKFRTFQSRLREDIKDPEFRVHYEEEKQALMLAIKISELREKKGLSQQQLAKLMGTSQQAIRGSRVVSMRASLSRLWRSSLNQLGCGLKSSLLRHSLTAVQFY